MFLWRELRARILRLGPEDSQCQLCVDRVEQTLCHLMFECAGTVRHRLKLLRRVSSDLQEVPIEAGTVYRQAFERFSHDDKMLIILGKRTGVADVDMMIDRACRKYLKPMERLVGAAGHYGEI